MKDEIKDVMKDGFKEMIAMMMAGQQQMAKQAPVAVEETPGRERKRRRKPKTPGSAVTPIEFNLTSGKKQTSRGKGGKSAGKSAKKK